MEDWGIYSTESLRRILRIPLRLKCSSWRRGSTASNDGLRRSPVVLGGGKWDFRVWVANIKRPTRSRVLNAKPFFFSFISHLTFNNAATFSFHSTEGSRSTVTYSLSSQRQRFLSLFHLQLLSVSPKYDSVAATAGVWVLHFFFFWDLNVTERKRVVRGYGYAGSESGAESFSGV